MLSRYATTYRSILRELRKSLGPGRKVNTDIRSEFRSVIESVHRSNNVEGLEDVENAISLLHAQREYKRLLDRYNPPIDYTDESRIQATARRVGFNMPKLHKPETS